MSDAPPPSAFTDLRDRLRRRLGDTSPVAVRFTNDELGPALADARRALSVRRVPGFPAMTVDLTPGAEAFAPAPTEEQGELLVQRAAVDLLRSTYRDQVARGTLGVSWKSGFEEESTISQQKAFEGLLADLEADLETLVLVARSGAAGARTQ